MAFQPLPILSDLTAAGTLAALNDVLVLECNGISSGKFVVSGTWVGTIKLQQSIDGTRWDDVIIFSETNGAILFGAGITANDLISFIGIGGASLIRATFTSYTSGSAVVTIRASAGVGHVDQADGPVVPGTVAVKSSLAGGQYNSTLPTLTTAQQSAVQLDSRGRLLVTASNYPTSIDTNYGTVGASTPRSASQIGNSTGAALFGAGTTTAQVLRVVLPTDQTAIPASQSGTWTVQPGNTANTTAWFVKDNSLGTVGAGTAGTQSSLAGGVFNTALPTLTNGQQASLQLDSSGRLIISPVTQTVSGTVAVSNLPSTVDTNYGTVGASTIRGAAQIGNATGAADFNSGATGAQTLRTHSNQGAPNSVANSWPVKVSDGTDSVAVTTNGDLSVSDGLSNGGVHGNLALTTANTAYEAKVGGSRLANRKSLSIVPTDADVYWGYDNTVTTSNGTPLKKDQSIVFSIDPDSTFQVWLVCASSSKNARVTESP